MSNTQTRPHIAAYSLCYMEGALLAANIRRMYDLIDEFRVVIGPANVGAHYHAFPDHESAEIIRRIPDPQHKIRLVVSETAWLSKEIMTQVATHDLKADILLQLDADEFWPLDTFKRAVAHLIENDLDRLGVWHAMFFGDCDHLTARPCDVPGTGALSSAALWFYPIRLMKVHPGCTVRHVRPAFVSTDGRVWGDRINTLLITPPVWHFAWIGQTRVLRKREYYAKARHMPMFSVEQWNTARDRGWPRQTLTINNGPVTIIRCPEAVKAPADVRTTVLEALGEGVVTG